MLEDAATVGVCVSVEDGVGVRVRDGECLLLLGLVSVLGLVLVSGRVLGLC